MNLPESKQCTLIVVDIQERLIKAMDENRYQHKMVTTVKIASALGIPTVVTEQYPRGLGETILEIKEALPAETQTFEKTTFPCWGAEGFKSAVDHIGNKTLIVIGMESHVCVLQTVLEALEEGYEVLIPVDCVCSRNELDKKYALKEMQQAGATLTTIERLAFGWLKGAKHPDFRTISKLI
ncbi:MAG: isochorismatase family protein, partial [Lentisphaeria bacterium]|nr:isochorismatase family protein [Lentisphaeria bacterium]